MKTRLQDGYQVVLDGDQTFEAFLEIAGQEVTDEVFLQDGMLLSDAVKLLEMAVAALENTAITTGWRAK